jgi:predicted AAA+ superfamily ATPase
MKPWREIAIPHSDVLKGTFQQSEFAADITAVHTGKATAEYADAAEFFRRTYVTAGMETLLTLVMQRLAKGGGEPVIQLQTAFGGGKTHTLLAVYHLATRSCPLSELPGVPPLVERAGLMDVPKARVAVIDGTRHSPGAAWKHGKQAVKTLWGELAMQLAGGDGFALVKDADANGTSPGKDALAELLALAAPCVVLMDELVVYLRQFPEGQVLSGGTYDSNLSFFHSLTEAVKLVPNAVVLASLPDSHNAGGDRGRQALSGLEGIFKRLEALWRPVATEEAFEIIRRRLFEPIRDEKARDAACRAFADAYAAEGPKLPTETQESRYRDRLLKAYPIHPEVFDRLYEDWAALENFQRTRGVLKLLAKVIHRLWKDDNKDYLILPASLPLYDSTARSDLTSYLKPGWDSVLDGDIDGDKAETTELEQKEVRFGQLNAARRVARTLFLGTAPSSVAATPGTRGLDRARVLLGCLQPGQSAAVYSDALNRLADRLHYLNSTGDKSADTTRFWFDTIANLRREMEDRKGRFDEKTEVRKKVEEAVKKSLGGVPLFDGVHVFTPHKDVPDDSALRLVILPPDAWYSKDKHQTAVARVKEYLAQNGEKPRQKSANRLLFVAPDFAVLARLTDSARVALAWGSIVDDIAKKALVIDQPRQEQAKNELAAAAGTLEKVARECYKWLLCPVQHDPTATEPTIEAYPLNTGGKPGAEIEATCVSNELVIKEWSPVHLRTALREFYWKYGKTATGALRFWEDTQKYLYLPRLKDRRVLERVIHEGAASGDFFGTAQGQAGETFEGFRFGEGGVLFSDTLLLIEPEAAKNYAAKLEAQKKAAAAAAAIPAAETGSGSWNPASTAEGSSGAVYPPGKAMTPPPKKFKAFHGTADIAAANAKAKLIDLAEEIIAVLCQDPNATVKVSVEISADFPQGAPDHVKRAVSENATALGLKRKEWE